MVGGVASNRAEWNRGEVLLVGCGKQGDETHQDHAGVCTQVPGKLIHCKWGPRKRDSAKLKSGGSWINL